MSERQPARRPTPSTDYPRTTPIWVYVVGVPVILVLGGIYINALTEPSGTSESSSSRPDSAEAATAPSAPPAPSPAGETDSFGRSPGDEHYGHDHPSKGQAPAPTGKTDSFGRSPGDEHYGHDHP